MADYTSFVETTARKVYVLPSPTNAVEVDKVISALEHDLSSRGIKNFDDTVTVEALDDEIRFSYEIEKTEESA